MLKYLNVHRLYEGGLYDIDINRNNRCDLHRRQMIIGESFCSFKNFETVIKQMTNLNNIYKS
jgi:hypothetical protein